MAPAGWAGPLSPHQVAGSRAPCTKAYESFVPAAAAASIGFAASSVGAVNVSAAVPRPLCAYASSTLGIGLHGKTTRRSSSATTVTFHPGDLTRHAKPSTNVQRSVRYSVPQSSLYSLGPRNNARAFRHAAWKFSKLSDVI